MIVSALAPPRVYADGGPLIPCRTSIDHDISPECGHPVAGYLCGGCGACTACPEEDCCCGPADEDDLLLSRAARLRDTL